MDDEEPLEVSDSYVARRVAEHRAAIAEAGSQDAEGRGDAGAASAQNTLGIYLLLGLLVASLLLIVIHVATQRSPAPSPPRPTHSASPSRMGLSFVPTAENRRAPAHRVRMRIGAE